MVNLTTRTYLDNLMSILRNDMTAYLKSIRKEKQRVCEVAPLLANAYYLQNDNTLNVPYVLLDSPIYNPGLKSLQYGGLGFILGHEMLHGFDRNGIKYNKDGAYENWWSNEMYQIFESKTKCFIIQYNRFKLENTDKYVNGTITVNENIADNGALHQAYKAYQTFVSKNGQEPLLPGFENYTNNQLFFISFANTFCGNTDPQIREQLLRIDNHGPIKVRVLATLQNSEDFADAYKCKMGTKMNPPREKCILW